jgi:hypothetical protein
MAETTIMSTRRPVNPMLVGLLALGCLLGGVGMLALHSLESEVGASLLRTGVLLGAVWLALPTRRREAAWAHLSPWTLVGLVGLCLLAGRHKYVFLGGVALMAVIAIFLRPRPPR